MMVMCGHEEEEENTKAQIDLVTTLETPEEKLEVSLHPLTNPINPCILRISAKQKTETLEVLIDTGSNTNFVQEGIVHKLGLPIET